MSVPFGMAFDCDAAEDTVYAYPCGTIDSDEVCAKYEKICDTFYSQYGRKVDVIVTLEMWSVTPDMTDAYEKASRRIMERFIRLLVVVDQNPKVSVRVTSVRKTGSTVAFASSTIEAGDALKKMRKRL